MFYFFDIPQQFVTFFLIRSDQYFNKSSSYIHIWYMRCHKYCIFHFFTTSS